VAEKTRVRWIVNTHLQLDGVIRKRTKGDVDYLPRDMAAGLISAKQVVSEATMELDLPEDAELFLEGFAPQLPGEGDDECSESCNS